MTHTFSRKNLSLLVLLFAASSFWNCAVPLSKPDLLEVPPKNEGVEKKWESFGAYYEVDEIFVEATYMTGFNASMPQTKYIINKKIKILTDKGSEYGTLFIPRYFYRPRKFKVEVTKPNGEITKVSTSELTRQFMKNKPIVIPKITAGCQISIYMEGLDNGSVTSFEHYFSQDIPVYHGKLTFSSYNKFNYKFKEYGGLQSGMDKTSGHKQLRYRVWEVKNLQPRARVSFIGSVDESEPRMAAVMVSHNLQFTGSTSVYESWSKMADSYEEQLMAKSWFNSSYKTKKLVDSLKAGKEGSLERADGIFSWVQSNIDYERRPLKPINLDKILKNKKGNIWEMAALLNFMFTHEGFETDIVVTRPKSNGGFDAYFVTPQVLSVPLVKVKVADKWLLSFPYSKAAVLGEYPPDYFGLQGLSLNDGVTPNLPEPISGKGKTEVELSLDLDNVSGDNIKYHANLEYSGVMAYIMRNRFINQEEKIIREGFQKYLEDLGTSNKLTDFEIKGLEDRGEPIKVALTFENANQSFSRKKQTQINLSNIFNSYFELYDTNRVEDLSFSLEYEYNEKLVLNNSVSKNVKAEIHCSNVANQVFESSCGQSSDSGSDVYERKFKLKKISINSDVMRSLLPDINSVNKIKDSFLVLNK